MIHIGSGSAANQKPLKAQQQEISLYKEIYYLIMVCEFIMGVLSLCFLKKNNSRI